MGRLLPARLVSFAVRQDLGPARPFSPSRKKKTLKLAPELNGMPEKKQPGKITGKQYRNTVSTSSGNDSNRRLLAWAE
jgi:hypothetical protein